MKGYQWGKHTVYLALVLGLAAGFLGYGISVHGDWTRRGAALEQAVEQEQSAAPTATVAQESGAAAAGDDLDNTKHGWGIKTNQEHRQPEMPSAIGSTLAQYQAYWVGGAQEKIVYLTFDEGYENGYTPQILDTLQKNNVPAAFFVTGHYLKTQPELVQRMAREGHIVGNHTDTHPSLPDVSRDQIEQELQTVEQSIQTLTGGKSAPYLRPPKGEYSQRTLAITHQLGYHNIFWSLAMVDWTPMPGGPEQAYRGVLDNLHPGAVILLHAVSEDNAKALDRILQAIKGQGYQFKTLDHLAGRRG